MSCNHEPQKRINKSLISELYSKTVTFMQQCSYSFVIMNEKKQTWGRGSKLTNWVRVSAAGMTEIAPKKKAAWNLILHDQSDYMNYGSKLNT